MLKVTFLVLTGICLFLFFNGTGKDRRSLLMFAGWQVAVSLLSFLRFFEQNPALFPGALLISGWVSYCMVLRIREIKTPYLLALQMVRIPVELILYQLYLQEKIPSIMTFEGWNFDILFGVSAVLFFIYFFVFKQKLTPAVMLLWNIWGMVSVLFVVVLAILSSPLPIQLLGFDQPNIAVLEFPFGLLPAAIVPMVVLAHLLLLRSVQKTG